MNKLVFCRIVNQRVVVSMTALILSGCWPSMTVVSPQMPDEYRGGSAVMPDTPYEVLTPGTGNSCTKLDPLVVAMLNTTQRDLVNAHPQLKPVLFNYDDAVAHAMQMSCLYDASKGAAETMRQMCYGDVANTSQGFPAGKDGDTVVLLPDAQLRTVILQDGTRFNYYVHLKFAGTSFATFLKENESEILGWLDAYIVETVLILKNQRPVVLVDAGQALFHYLVAEFGNEPNDEFGISMVIVQPYYPPVTSGPHAAGR